MSQKSERFLDFLLDKIGKGVIFKYGRGERERRGSLPRTVVKITVPRKIWGGKTSFLTFYSFFSFSRLHG
jgi:hypothetical protein